MNASSLLLLTTSTVFSFSAAAQNVADSVPLTDGQPSSSHCQYADDLGRLAFDPDSGRLWACGNDGFVYFESKSSSQYQCLNDQAATSNYPEWKPRKWNVKNGMYYKGEVVRHKGKLYTPTNGTAHGGSSPSKASWDWQLFVADNQLPTRWEVSHSYRAGDRVVHMGIEYVAREANSNKAPNDQSLNYQPWDYVGAFECPKD